MMKVMIAGIWVTAKIGDNFMRSKSSSNSDILQISSSYYVSLLFGSQSKDQIIMGFFFKHTVKLSTVQYVEDESDKLGMDTINQDISTKSKLRIKFS